MNRYLARVYVSLKPTVNDPEGLTIRGALVTLGYNSVESVRAGKYFQIEVESPSKREASESVEGMCKQLLANPIIEQYEFELTCVG
jgi:phosphoribosylformylglycinamidine synthase